MEYKKVFHNATWIVGGKIVQSLLALIISMLTARYLGPSNFGLISYASSIVAFLAPVMHLGINSVLVQELVTSPENTGEALGTTITLCFCSSLVCIIGVGAFVSLINKNEIETLIVCILYSLVLIFQAAEMIQYWYQAKLLSKYATVVSLIAYFILSIYKIILLLTGKSIYWFAISNALDIAIIAVGLFVLYKKLGGQKLKFSKDLAIRLLHKGRYYIVSSLMVTIFAQTDRIMIKLMISDAATGYYTAATTIAGMGSFVFSALIDSFRPLILTCKNQKEFEKSMSRLYSIVIYLALSQSVIIALFSKYIVLFIYGEAYMPAVSALQIVVWYTTFSYLGAARNIWILCKNKHKYLWVINLSGALTNVLLNTFLIPVLGINGAALASLITQIFTNFIMGYIIRPISDNNTLMLKSLNPKYLIDMIQATLRGLKNKR